MRFGFNDEQAALQEALRRFLEETAGRERARETLDAGLEYDAATWRRAADELELAGIAVPEGLGGSGGGTVELALVLEEHGRTLAPSPYLATAGLAAPMLLAAGGPVAEQHLTDIAGGTVVATATLPVGAGSPARPDVRADAQSRLIGTCAAVLNGSSADLLVVPAETADGRGLFVVEADALTRAPYDAAYAYDRTSGLSPITFDATPARRIDQPGEPDVDDGFARAAVSIAAVQLGGASACLDAAVAYARTRSQFGRPIGSFQAIKHRCADVLLRVEAARSLVFHAAWLADQGATDDLLLVAPMAKAWCSDTYVQAAEAHLLIHGGIGFTWEHDAHLHVRRAHFLSLLLGSADDHRDLLMTRLRAPKA